MPDNIIIIMDKVKESLELNAITKSNKMKTPSKPINHNPEESKIPSNEDTSTVIFNTSIKTNVEDGFVDMKALKMMEKMGYKKGSGLGKFSQGRVNPIDLIEQVGKQGLGFTKSSDNISTSWKFDNEEGIELKETISWISAPCDATKYTFATLKSWIVEGKQKVTLDKQFCNCSEDLYKEKDSLDLLEPHELIKARSRANPFETIKNVFFLNRAAVKMANIDAACGFLFTTIENDPNHKTNNKPYYFADVCGGPGGFSEYILWRKQWLYKGFGFTLRGENDFRLNDFFAAPTETFQTLYGAKGDGNIYDPSNITDFVEKVLLQTDNLGVHFMMSDGGFSVDGRENMQEVLSKQIYVCQCLIALSIVRTHGHFVTKLFDTLTLFSVGLIYLMYLCFEEVSIFKPNTSRPANSEKYLICKNKRSNTETVREILEYVNNKFWNFGNESEMDINQLIPTDVIIFDDILFYLYVYCSNNKLASRQSKHIKKIINFSKNLQLIEKYQSKIRSYCLENWKLPDGKRTMPLKKTPMDWMNSFFKNSDFMFVNPMTLVTKEDFGKNIDSNRWNFFVNGSMKNKINTHFYLSMGGTKVYVFNNKNWMLTTSNMELPFGTLIYAEEVTEFEIKCPKKYHRIRSLHIIDACFLGDVNIQNLVLSERLKMIAIFCTAVNRPFRNDLMRIRMKPMLQFNEFKTINQTVTFMPMNKSEKLMYKMPKIINRESYVIINSIMFIKTDDIFTQTFEKLFVWNLQLNNKTDLDIYNENITWNNIRDIFVD